MARTATRNVPEKLKAPLLAAKVSGTSIGRRDPSLNLIGGARKSLVLKQQKEINSVQTRCIVKGEAQKSPLFWRFSGGF